ncbi:MAG TPA: site-specific integrase, partial [Streptosporangiaceae bacterium]
MGGGNDVTVLSDDDVWRQYKRLLRHRRDSDATIHTYDVALHLLWCNLEQRGIRWDRVTPDDVESWLQAGRCPQGKRNAGLPWSNGTKHVHGARVLTFYTEATEQGWLKGANPLRNWKPPRRPGRRPRALPVSAVGQLLVELADDQRLRIVAMICYFQALRIGEVCRLSVEDVALSADPPMLRVEGKGGQETWMPLSPALVPGLRAFLLTRPASGPLIPNFRFPTEHLSARYGARLLAAAMRPVVGDSGHALRHTAAQQLRRLTRDPFIVRDALRHSSLEMQSS